MFSLTRNLQKAITYLCLVIYFTAGTFRAQSRVLCVGPDGHVAIEAVHKDSRCDGCTPIHQERTQPGTLAAVADHGQCPCVDFPLGATTEVARTRRDLPALGETNPDVKVAALVEIAVAPLPALTRFRAPRGSRSPRDAGQLDRIRTVVLLL